MTNIQRVTRYMDFGKQGALNQAFVIEAISRYAKEIVENETSFLKAMEGGFIHGPTWVACAKEWIASENLPPSNVAELKQETGIEDDGVAREILRDFRLSGTKKTFKDWWAREQKRY